MLDKYLLAIFLMLQIAVPISATVVTDGAEALAEKIDIVEENKRFDEEAHDQLVAEEAVLLKDVILVLDNSGSMRKHDPEFLTRYVVTEFIKNLDDSYRVAIISFDEQIKILMPLTDISTSTKEEFLTSLEGIDYKGLYTNSPAAMENAIYNMRNNARESARKIIIFMTDGIVDTGNVDRDLEKTKWLREYLAADAADADIRIIGIAFTENADFELIQSLAQKTNGEYYRVLSADDLPSVFGSLQLLINMPDEPEIIAEPEPKIIEKIRIIERAPVIEQVTPIMQPQIVERPESTSSKLILFILPLLLLLVIVMVIMLWRNKSADNIKETAPEAYLYDVQGVTGQKKISLGIKPTMLGRIAGRDHENLDYLVVPETTIGRNHALIQYKDFAYWLIDQGSINGTFINDKAILSATRLQHDDIIRLHNIQFMFIMPEMDDAGMTVISHDVASQAMTGDEATLMPDHDPIIDQKS